VLSTAVVAPLMSGSPFLKVATAAAIVGGGVYLLGLILSFLLPEPKGEE
jgi:hypothetical protein